MSNILNRLAGTSEFGQRCPNCDASVPAESINIAEGVALCGQCGKLSRLAELLTSGRPMAEVLSNPPSGCTTDTDGQSVTYVASMRSLVGFLMTGAFALFWNGITSVFVCIAIAGLYANLVGPIPDWFPAPGVEDGQPQMEGGPMTLGNTLFLCLFLTPFVTVGVGMAIATFMNLFGRVKVVINPVDAYAGTGVGLFQWKKRFDPGEVRSVEMVAGSRDPESGMSKALQITGKKDVKFGSMLTAERLEWLHAVLKQRLLGDGRASRI